MSATQNNTTERDMSTPMESARRKMDAIHTEMARLQKAISKLGERQNPTWADVGDMTQLLDYISAATEWME
jgi:hypothetical protein